MVHSACFYVERFARNELKKSGGVSSITRPSSELHKFVKHARVNKGISLLEICHFLPCLFDLACFFLPFFSSLIKTYIRR